MTDKKLDFSMPAYILGVLSIILGVTRPLAGFITGIVGIVLSKRQKGEFSRRGKLFSIIGIVISILVFVISIVVALYVERTGLGALQNLPTN